MIRNSEYEASDVVPGPGSNVRHPLTVFPSLHRVPAGPVPRLHQYYEGATTSSRPSRRTSFPSLGGTSVALVVSLPSGRVNRRGLELVTRLLHPGIAEETTGSPKFLRNQLSVCTCSNPTPAGLLAPDRSQCSSVALGITKAKAPTKGLSTLNSMAFGLAVYASQDGLPRHHARLASGRWSGATGRAFHPQGSYERFQSCILTSHPPFPSFAWHRPGGPGGCPPGLPQIRTCAH